MSGIAQSLANATKVYREWARQLEPTLDPADQALLELSLEQLENQELVIVVMGEFSVGKSTFLNALLRRRILVSHVLEATSTVTFLNSIPPDHEGPAEHAKVTFLDPRKKPIWVPFTELETYTTALEGNETATIERVDLYVDESIVPPGVRIVDTPGLNGLAPHLEEITYRQLALSHAVFFLFTSGRIGVDTEIQALRRVARYASNVLYIVNKWDKAVNLGKTRNWFAEVLHNILRDNGLPIAAEIHRDIFCISSKKILDHLDGALVDLDSEQEFDGLRARIEEIISGDARVRQLLLQPLQVMHELGGQQLARLETELETLGAQGPDAAIEEERRTIEKRQEEVEGVYEQLTALARSDASVEAQLAGRALRALAGPLKQQVAELVRSHDDILSEEFQTRVQSHINEQLRIEALEQISQLFEALMEHLAAELLDKTQTSFASLNLEEDLVSSIGMDYKPSPAPAKLEMRHALSAAIERADSRVQDTEKLLKEAKKDLKVSQEASVKYEEAFLELNRFRADFHSLGARPAVEVSYSTRSETYTRDPDGFFESVGAFFGQSYKATRQVSVRHEDDSKSRRWDKKAKPIRKKIAKREAEIERHALTAGQLGRAEERIRELEGRLKRLRLETQDLREEQEREMVRLRREARDARRRFVLRKWSEEIDRTLHAIETDLEQTLTRTIDQMVGEVRALGQASLDAYREELKLLETQRLQDDHARVARTSQCRGEVATMRNLLTQMEASLSSIS